MNKQYLPNQLAVYRRRMRLSQSVVARLLGHKGNTTVVRYESGELLPTFAMALRLEIIYRVPVAFLFPALYESFREQIRSAETALTAKPGQQRLI